MGGNDPGDGGELDESLWRWAGDRWVEVGADPLGRFFPAIPERWAVHANRTRHGLLVGLALFRTALATRSSVVRLSDYTLRIIDVGRHQLYRTLDRLEELGLIRCDRRNGAKTQVEILALEGEEDRTDWCLGRNPIRRGSDTNSNK